MIGTIDVKIQAHNPNFPLEPVFTFINSAQSFRIRNVPKRIGRWEINKVFVNVTYPDTTVISKECVLNGGVWVGTIEGCSISGKTSNGFVVTASGIDENELPISNYVLGAGDVFVQDLDGSISPDVNAARMYFYSILPVSPKKGEATFIEGVLNVYDGTQWKPALEVDLTNYYDKDEIDDIIENVEESIPTKTSDLTNDSGFVTTEEVKPFYEYDTSTATTKPTEMACYSVVLAGAYKANNRADKYAEVQPLVDFDPVELTPKFTLGALYLGYYPWKLSKFFDQTYSPELELIWWYGQVCRVIGGHFIAMYTGFMWRTKGIGFAIPCDKNGIPDGRLFEITLVEETSPYRIGFNMGTPTHTITGNENWSAILTIDEQENQITCTRNIVQRVKENRQTFPTLDDIPKKTSDLTNDSGFITAEQVPTQSYIEDTDGNKIQADLSYSNLNWTGWRIEGTDEILTGEKGAANNMPTSPEVDDEYYLIIFRTLDSKWELDRFVWTGSEWYNNANAETSGTIEDTTVDFSGWQTLVQVNESGKLATNSEIPTKTSDLTNDSNFITSEQVEPFYNFGSTASTGTARYAVCLYTSTGGSGKLDTDGWFETQSKIGTDLIPQLEAHLGYSTYYNFVLSKFFSQTYSPSLELIFWKNGSIKKLVNNRPRTYYDGCMYRTVDAGFAIPCSSEGVPDGRLIEFTRVSPSYIAFTNEDTQVHTITGNTRWTSIETIDGQSGEIACTRTNEYKMNSRIEKLAKESQLPTKTSDLTNDSGFITAEQVPTQSLIQDNNGNKIEANLAGTQIISGDELKQISQLDQKWHVTGTYNGNPIDVILTNSRDDDTWSDGNYTIQYIEMYEDDWVWLWNGDIRMIGNTNDKFTDEVTFDVDDTNLTAVRYSTVKVATESWVRNLIQTMLQQ